MSNRNGNSNKSTGFKNPTITGLAVSGYKSIGSKQQIEIRPLTILSGANSSGKSSLLQALLLLKQTLESSYDPGAILLDGANAKFTAAEQFMSNIPKGNSESLFCIEIIVNDQFILEIEYAKQSNKKIDIQRMRFVGEKKEKIELRSGMASEEIIKTLPPEFKQLVKDLQKQQRVKWEWEVVRQRCFLALKLFTKDKQKMNFRVLPTIAPTGIFDACISGIIHLPGLRGNPERTSPVSAVGETFPGTFENYTASVISHWKENNPEKLKALGKDLEDLGLTWKVDVSAINETQVELKVGRLPHAARGGGKDLVNIADVGFGVSQTLPVLVALQIARPGQLVYLEQPEIHLHPRAQVAMANIIANAASRGVNVVVETHSSLLLLGIQTLIADKKLDPKLVKLHWFTRNQEGSTVIKSADLDEIGAFGDWPEDFADVEMEAESRYLDAAEARQPVH